MPVTTNVMGSPSGSVALRLKVIGCWVIGDPEARITGALGAWLPTEFTTTVTEAWAVPAWLLAVKV